MKKLIIALSTITIITSCSNQNNSEATVETKNVAIKSNKELLNDFRTENKKELDTWAQKVDSVLLLIDASTKFITTGQDVKVDTFLNKPINADGNIRHILLSEYKPTVDTSNCFIIDKESSNKSAYYFSKTTTDSLLNKFNFRDNEQYKVNDYINALKSNLSLWKSPELLVFHNVSNYAYGGFYSNTLVPSSFLLTSYVFNATSLKLVDSFSYKIENSKQLSVRQGKEFEDINSNLLDNAKYTVKYVMKKHFILKNENHDFKASFDKLKFNKEEAMKQQTIKNNEVMEMLKKKVSGK